MARRGLKRFWIGVSDGTGRWNGGDRTKGTPPPGLVEYLRAADREIGKSTGDFEPRVGVFIAGDLHHWTLRAAARSLSQPGTRYKRKARQSQRRLAHFLDAALLQARESGAVLLPKAAVQIGDATIAASTIRLLDSDDTFKAAIRNETEAVVKTRYAQNNELAPELEKAELEHRIDIGCNFLLREYEWLEEQRVFADAERCSEMGIIYHGSAWPVNVFPAGPSSVQLPCTLTLLSPEGTATHVAVGDR
jgi:hypothetical protein